MFLRPLPLSVRLTLWHSLMFLGSALVLLALTYALLRKRANASERDSVEFRLWQYSMEYQTGGLPAIQKLAAKRKGRAQKAFFVRVGDANNRPIYQRDAEDWAEFNLEQLDRQPLPPENGYAWQNLLATNGTQLLIAAERLHDGGVLQVGKSNEELNEVLTEYRRSAALVLIILVPAGFAGGAFLASRSLRPVQQLTDTAQEIVHTGKFDARVPAPGTEDELDSLVRVFNAMLDRINALVHGMSDSLDNVAHDLRTPLTRMRAHAQSVLESDASDRQSHQCTRCDAALEALATCVEEADKVAVMLNTLMDISEAESGLVRLQTQRLSVASLATRAVSSYEEMAEDRGVQVQCNIPEQLQVRGDELAISRVFSNVIDNAIKYTPPGGKIRVAAQKRDDIVEITVSDSGIGISEDDLPRIWERLFRSDRSRSERGLGLGLSFVRAIVHAHGGTVAAESRLGQGTTMRITLPGVPTDSTRAVAERTGAAIPRSPALPVG